MFPGSIDGNLNLTPGLGVQAGDCLDLVQVQFAALTSTQDLGPDGLPCTADDFSSPTTPLEFPLTTGTAQAIVHNAPAGSGGGTCVKAGHCDGGAKGVCNHANGNADCTGTSSGTCVLDSCVQNANCAAGVPTDTCSGNAATFNNLTQTVTGARISCSQILTSNLSGMGIVGAIPLAGLIPPDVGVGDVAAGFRFGCR